MTAGIEVALIGRVGTEPEYRLVKAGTMPLLSFSVAVDTGATDQDAPPQWLKVAVFKALADDLKGKVTKGSRLYLEGRLSLPVGVYEARDGSHRASVEMLANVVQPLGQIGRRRPRQSSNHERARRMQAPPDRWVDDSEAAIADLEGGR